MRWDGTKWVAVGSASAVPQVGEIRTLNYPDGLTPQMQMRWDGTKWLPVVSNPGAITNPGGQTVLRTGTSLTTGSTGANAQTQVSITTSRVLDLTGKDAGNTVKPGYKIEIGGLGLDAFNRFELHIGNQVYEFNNAVISANKLTLTLHPSGLKLPANIPSNSPVRVKLISNAAGVQSGFLDRIFFYQPSQTVSDDLDLTDENDNNAPLSLTLSATSASVAVGQSRVVTATISVADSMMVGGISVVSSAPGIARASISFGLGGAITITGVSAGTAVITVHPSQLPASDTSKDKIITVTVISTAGSNAASGAQGRKHERGHRRKWGRRGRR